MNSHIITNYYINRPFKVSLHLYLSRFIIVFTFQFMSLKYHISNVLYILSLLRQDEDFQEIEDAGRKMEQHYCQFFDHVIVNDGLQAACVQLLTAVRRAQDEPQWVPTAWIRPTDQS